MTEPATKAIETSNDYAISVGQNIPYVSDEASGFPLRGIRDRTRGVALARRRWVRAPHLRRGTGGNPQHLIRKENQMATCDILDLCLEATVDPNDEGTILIRETEIPETIVRTSRKNFAAFAEAVKEGKYDDLM
jgi:hypothetical protein